MALSSSLIEQIANNPPLIASILQTLVGVTILLALSLVGLAIAITQKQQAQALLQKQSASLAAVQHKTQVGTWELTVKDCPHQDSWVWSDEHYRLLGFSPSAIAPSQKDFLLRVHPDDRDQVQQCLNGAIFDRKPYSLVYRVVSSDRSERLLSEQVEVSDTRLLGIVQDVTEQQHVAQRDRLLREITDRIRQSLDVDEILSTTVAEVRNFFNADRVYIFQFDDRGYAKTVAESVDSDWQSILGNELPIKIVHDIEQIFEHTRIRVNHDSEQVEKTSFLGRYYQLFQIKASLATPIRKAGQIFGVLNINQCSSPRQWQAFEVELLDKLATQVEIAIQQGDLYQQVQRCASDLEEQVEERTLQLQQNMEQLQDLNLEKDRLLHAVTHDLQTPLLGTLMVLRQLQSRSDSAIVLSRSIVDSMMASCDRQLILIRSLLEDQSDSQTYKSRALILNRKPFQLSELVQSTLQELTPILTENQVKLENLIPSSLPTLMADGGQIRRVLDQVIVNACKHNHPGLMITIAAKATPEKLHCTIADNGIGMSQEQCKQVFQKPYLKGFDNRNLTGLGLGLFICHQIVAAHGGQIGVTSSPSSGTTVWFALPL